ncbi:MAG TPA: GAF domain-containing protein [Gaiellaceae bacterium]
MSDATKSVVFNAAPLFALAAIYAIVTGAVVPTLWRERRRLGATDVAVAAIFPCIAIPAAVIGGLVLHDRRPIGGHVWPPFAATLVALLPGLLLLVRWRDRGLLAAGSVRTREAEAKTTLRDRELEAVSTISNALARTHDAKAAARILLDEVGRLFDVEFTALALVSDDGREATGFVARQDGRDVDWWHDVRLDLEHEPSAIASAVFEAAPVTVYDVAGSTRVSRRLAEQVGARSGAWTPLISEERVIAVLVAVSIAAHRSFTAEELTLMQALAGEAALALDRTRSAEALERALERERLIARVARKVRSELDVRAVLEVAVHETADALGGSRCFVRLREDGRDFSVAAEWRAPGLPSVAPAVRALAVSNLALRDARTVAVEDVAADPAIADPELGGREPLLELGSRSALATPIGLVDETIGVLAVHRSTPGPWVDAEVALLEAIARELGLALHIARLLAENEQRLEQQARLLRAAQALTSELQLDVVLPRLVEQVAQLLGVDAADCYLLDPARGTLRCAAVYGLPSELVGFEFPVDKGVAGEALRSSRPVIAADYQGMADPVPHAAYAGFSGAIVAPMVWGGETLGVLGVGRVSGGPFEPAEADALEAFAGLASLALRNAETFAERTRQAQVQRGFYRIASVLGQSLSLAATYEAVAQAATEALGGSYAAVLMPRTFGLELVGAFELPERLREVLAAEPPPEVEPVGDAAAAGRLIALPAVADDERLDADWRRLLGGCGCRSLLAVPVEDPRGESAGLVLVAFRDDKTFTDDDLELARHLGDAARGALERSGLFEAERTARALAQQLARTGGLLATELDPAAVLDEVVQQAPALLGAEACTIRVLDGDELVVSAVEGEDVADLLGEASPARGRLSDDVVQSRGPVAIDDTRDDPRLAAADTVLSRGYSSYLGVPLVGPEGLLHGVLSVYGRRPRTWREEEVEALLALAANTSAALSNAELYQRVALEKERSFAILANIADGIVAVDRDGKVVLWNRAAEQITGVPSEEALGRTPAQVLQRGLESQGDAPAGDRLVSIVRGGEDVWLSLTEAVMRDPAGAVAGRIFAFRDISADRSVEQMKSEFVAAVSHELRTPLTSIYGFAETLLRQDVLFGEEERRTFLGYIASESDRLTSIVDALLNVARLDTGDLQVNLASTEVGSIVDEVVASAQVDGAVDAHQFVVDVPERPLTAEADAEKLRQILGALVDNAVKYSPDGGTVTIGAHRRGGTVELEVVDEGMGIPQGERERIFRKFYRAETAGRNAGAGGGGSGLGLFIARGLVEAMGGHIEVASQEGQGSRFWFELPLARTPIATSVD